MAVNNKAWKIGFRREIGDESNPTYSIVIGGTSNALHLIDPLNAGTDFNVSASTTPTLYIHGSATAVTEYIKQWTDETDAHYDVVGANLDIDVPTSGKVSIQVNDTDEYTFDASNLTLESGNKVFSADLVLNSTNMAKIQIGAVDILGIGSVAAALTAGSGVDGRSVYLRTQTGGSGITYGKTAASIFIQAGDGGAPTAGSGGAGGSIRFTAGTGAANSGVGTTAAGGIGGDIILEPGQFQGTGSSGYIQLLGSATWVAASTGTTVWSGIIGPAGLTGSAIAEWLRVKNESGTVCYIPCFV